MTDIFDIYISYDDCKEIIRCWAYNPNALANFRAIPQNHDDLGDFDPDATGDKYMADRIKLIKAESMTISDLEAYKNKNP